MFTGDKNMRYALERLNPAMKDQVSQLKKTLDKDGSVILDDFSRQNPTEKGTKRK